MKFIAGTPKGETVAKFVYEGELDGIRDDAKANNFSGKERELMVAYPGKPAKRLIVEEFGSGIKSEAVVVAAFWSRTGDVHMPAAVMSAGLALPLIGCWRECAP